ncbi:MAG: hypothetical protein ACE5GN_04755 [Waddliaceae bacterium]
MITLQFTTDDSSSFPPGMQTVVEEGEVETFTQRPLESLLKEAKKNKCPLYLLGVAILEPSAGGHNFNYYDGRKVATQHFLKPESLDPKTQRKIEEMHFFATRTFVPSGKDRSIKFEGLRPHEMSLLMWTIIALDDENPFIDVATRVKAATIVAKTELRHYEWSDKASRNRWLHEAKKFLDYGDAMIQSAENIPVEVSQKIGKVKEMCQKYLNSEFESQKSRKEKQEIKNQTQEKILQLLTTATIPLSCNQMNEQLGTGKTVLHSELQRLVHQKRILEIKTDDGKQYKINSKLSFDDALKRIKGETGLEQALLCDSDWKEGVRFGKPRQGHPEGAVIYHILEILDNINNRYGKSDMREELRLLALVHDSFKHRVKPGQPKIRENHHGWYARAFTQQIIENEELLEIVQRHDEAYYIWRKAKKTKDWGLANAKAIELIERFPIKHALYLAFFEVDCKTGTKTQAPFDWFQGVYRSLKSTG